VATAVVVEDSTTDEDKIVGATMSFKRSVVWTPFLLSPPFFLYR
jgi:hypothetical protein